MIEPTYKDTLLRLPPPQENIPKNKMMHDFHNTFTKTMWYGNELRLFVFEALVFCALDMELKSVPITAFIVFIISR